jgi:hypothetical protein
MKAMRDKRMEARTNDDRTETTACQDAIEPNPEKMESNPEDKEVVVERQEVPKEDAAVTKPVNERRKWHRGRKSTEGRCGEPKELTRGNCGSWRKLAAACRKKVSRHATVAWRKRKLQKKWDPGKFWSAQGIDHCWNEKEPGQQR